MEWIGNCMVCGGRIYYDPETGEIDRSDCICNYIQRCGKCIKLRRVCRSAIGSDGCLGGECPPCDMNCDECPY